jgi:hypothetical protein
MMRSITNHNQFLLVGTVLAMRTSMLTHALFASFGITIRFCRFGFSHSPP